MSRTARQATITLMDLMDNGLLNPRTVADACLNYMSEHAVKDMAESEGFIPDDETENE